MKKYLDTLNKHPEFNSVILSVPNGDNFSLAYRHRGK